MIRLLRLGILFGLLVALFSFSGAAIGAPGDVDNDTFADASDNCPTVYNIDQKDFDGDGTGNRCDATPGVFDAADGSYTIIYWRNATTGGPLPTCANFRRDIYENNVLTTTTNTCHSQFDDFFNPSYRRQVITLTSAPAGCITAFTSATVGYDGNGTFTAIDVYFTCGGTTNRFVNELVVKSVGVGPGTSLADKAREAQAALFVGDTATACGLLRAYLNQLKAITKRTAGGIIEQLEVDAITARSTIGC